MVKRKQLFIFGGLAIIVIVILVFILVRNNGDKSSLSPVGQINQVTPPEFMSDAEKASFNLPADSKIQVLKKDEAGQATVYRIIRRDADIILDPSRVGEPGMIESGEASSTK